MSIINYLIEAMKMKDARPLIKKGRENYKTLPDELKQCYDNIFQGKQRKIIGQVEIDSEIMIESHFLSVIKVILENIKEDKLYIFDDLPIYQTDNHDTIQLATNDPDILNFFSQAKVENTKNIFSWKPFLKRVKMLIPKSKWVKLDEEYSKFRTAVSNTSDVPCNVVISKHPYDVAGMSTNRRWQSCKDINGMNKHYLDAEVGHLLIAYVVAPLTDKETEKHTDILSKPFSRTVN